MILFWMIAAVMVVVALVIVIPSLLGREPRPNPASAITLAERREQLIELANALEAGEITQEAFRAAQNAIGNTLVVELSVPTTSSDTPPTSKFSATVIAALIPITSVALYLWLGSTVSLSPENSVSTTADAGPAAVEEMVAGLAVKLRDQPDDPQGWLMLARSYSVMERYSQSRDAYAKAYELIGNETQLLVDYAEVIALTEENRLTGKPTELLDIALSLDPDNPKGLWLGGFAARQNGDNTRALELWHRLSRQLEADSSEIAMVQNMIAQVSGESIAQPPPAESTTEDTIASLEVRVSLDPRLADSITGDETLFIFARAVNGPPMPLAIQRRSAGELPLVVKLDDTMHMLPAFKLSTFPMVTVGARISRTGNATASSGDLQGSVTPIEVAAGGIVNLIIEQIVE